MKTESFEERSFHLARRRLLWGTGSGMAMSLLGSAALSGCGGGGNDASAPKVEAAPVILRQPQSLEVEAGQTFTLEVQASGSNLSYQWLSDGVPIGGATQATYTATPASSIESATYVVRVSNAGGQVLSAAATVRVVDARIVVPVARLHTGAPGSPGFADGSHIAGRFNIANYLAASMDGRLAISDAGNHRIRILGQYGNGVRTLAGVGAADHSDGQGTDAAFNFPGGVAFDSQGDLFVADWDNHVIRRVAPDGTVETVAGTPKTGGCVDGAAPNAQFANPNGLAVNQNDSVFVCDWSSHTVRMFDGTRVSTIAGKAFEAGSDDGPRGSSRLRHPAGLAVDAAGHLLVADQGNHVIRRIDVGGVVSTVAGQAGVAGYADGPSGTALFDQPSWLAVGPGGEIYVIEAAGTLVRRISPDGQVTTVVGTRGGGGQVRLGPNPVLHNARGLLVLAPDVLLIAADSALIEIQLPPPIIS